MARAEERTGWGGQIIAFLENVATKDVTQDSGRVVTLPRNTDKLHAEIRRTQNELTIAQTKRGQIALAWADIINRHEELIAANEAEQNEIIARLMSLQQQWADISKEVGVQASVVPAKVGG
jgi:hypothetical protein